MNGCMSACSSEFRLQPTQVEAEDAKFKQVACGGMHTVALATNCKVWTWGVNDEGALGRKTEGTCWEGLPEEEKASSMEPGLAELPQGVEVTQVRG